MASLFISNHPNVPINEKREKKIFLISAHFKNTWNHKSGCFKNKTCKHDTSLICVSQAHKIMKNKTLELNKTGQNAMISHNVIPEWN